MEDIKIPLLSPNTLRRIKTQDHENFFNEMQDALHLNTEHKHKMTFIEKITSNLKSGFILGMVNLPLCISLAVASGSTPTAGILSGIIAGVISGMFGGSNYNVLGPTGALSGFLAVIIQTHGIYALPFVSIITGIVTFIISIYGMERYIDLFPVAVNEGFTLGVALIIFFGQMNSALGIGLIKKKEYIRTETLNSYGEIIKVTDTQGEQTLVSNIILNINNIDQMKMAAFIIFLTFFISLYFLMKKYPSVPWIILSCIVGIFIGKQNLGVDTLESKYGDIQFQYYDFTYIKENSFTYFLQPALWIDCMPIVFVAVLETLISAKIADGLTNTRFKKKQELVGLGLSNLISGLLGGIPVTAALARTALNIKSGATYKYSAIINGIVMIVIGQLFIKFFKLLPMAVVSAQVCIVAVRMVNYHELYHLYKFDKKNFAIVFIIAMICFFKDPTLGVIFGMLIYLIKFCENLTMPWTEIITTHEKNALNQPDAKNYTDENFRAHLCDIPPIEGDYIVYRIIGIITFMNMSEHVDRIQALAHQDEKTIVISLRYMHLIDLDALYALKHIIEKLEHRLEKSQISMCKKIMISGISQSKLDLIKDEEWIRKMQKDGAIIFDDINPRLTSHLW